MEAVEIYHDKLAYVTSEKDKKGSARAVMANKYHFSPEAIMDIWNHKIWGHATSHLWHCANIQADSLRQNIKDDKTLMSGFHLVNIVCDNDRLSDRA